MNGSLFLSPQSPDSDYHDARAIASYLAESGLTAKQQEDGSYLCGESFAQLITFMGCSPHLVFEPPQDGGNKYCHIKLHEYQHIQLLTGDQTAPPRCPACRYRIGDWQQHLDDWKTANGNAWQCPQCQQESPAFKLDWRQSGGAGTLFIEIKNIFPGEAVPVDSFMDGLNEISGEPWRYFYLV